MARIVSTAAVNAIRNEYNVLNPVSGNYEDSILLEGSKTNLAIYSENFSVWSNSGFTVTSGLLDPAGGTNGTTLDDSSAVVRGGLGRSIVGASFGSDGEKCASIYIKQGTLTSFRLSLRDVTASVIRHEINVTWTAGIPVLTSATGAGTLYSVITLGNGWFRVAFSAAGMLAANSNAFEIYAGAFGADVGTVIVWGAQVEDATFPSSYIPTAAVAVTRSADNYSVPFNLPPQEMTVYCKFIEKGATLITNARIIHIGNAGSVGPRTLIYSPIISSGYVAYHQNTNGGASVAVAAAAVPVIGDLVELRMVLTGTGSIFFGQSINNGAEVISGPTVAHAFATAWSSPTLWVGQLGGSLNGNNAFQSVKIARGTLTLAQMRAL